MQLTSRIMPFKEMASNIAYPGLLSFAILSAITLSLLYISISNDINLIMLGGVCALPFLVFIPLYPKIWLYSLILSTPAFFYTSEEGVSALDFVLGFYYATFITVWLVWQLGVRKEKLVRNFADWIILFFFIMMIFNAIPATLNGVPISEWVREYARYIITLLYFPIRHYVKDKKDLKELMLVITASAVLALIVHFGFYYSMYQKKAVYAYELTRSIKNGLSFLLALNLVGALFLFKIENKRLRYLLFGFCIIAILALITTFARTFWVIYLFSAIFIFLSLNMKKKLYFILLMLLTSGVVIGGATLFLGKSSKLFINVIENRLTSSTMGKKDPSLESRMSEWDVVVEKIKENPLGGNGLMKKFHFYNPLTESTFTTVNIHNGYLFLIYRLGFPLALAYFIFIIYNFVYSINLYLTTKDEFLKLLALSCFLSILSMIISNLTSAQYTYRDGIFVIIYASALIGIVSKLKDMKGLAK